MADRFRDWHEAIADAGMALTAFVWNEEIASPILIDWVRNGWAFRARRWRVGETEGQPIVVPDATYSANWTVARAGVTRGWVYASSLYELDEVPGRGAPAPKRVVAAILKAAAEALRKARP